MSAQDEGQVPFGKLPLREIKDWLEDWMDLPNVNLLGGPGGSTSAPVQVINNELDEIGWLRDTSAWVQEPIRSAALGGGGAAVNLSTRVHCQRILPRGGFTVRSAKVAAQQASGHPCSYQVGIYNDDGSALIDRTDWHAIEPTNGDNSGYLSGTWEDFTNGDLDLEADTEYLICTIFRQDSGITAPSVMFWNSIGNHSAIYQPAGSTTSDVIWENYFSFRAEKNSGSWSDLLADLKNGAGAVNNFDVPLVLLNTA